MSEKIEKKSFKIYKEWEEQISCLDDESAGQLLKAIFSYQNSGEEPEMSPVVKMAFSFIKQQFERDEKSYEAISEKRSEAGSRGGAPKGNSNASKNKQNKQKQAKQAKTTKNKQNKLEEEDEVEDKDTLYPSDMSVCDNTRTHEGYGMNKNVFLSADELKILINEYGNEKTDRAIGHLSGYLAEKPEYKSQSHYSTILRWVMTALDEKDAKAAELENKLRVISKSRDKPFPSSFDFDLSEIYEKPEAVSS